MNASSLSWGNGNQVLCESLVAKISLIAFFDEFVLEHFKSLGILRCSDNSKVAVHLSVAVQQSCKLWQML